jgi:tetratricopeptide (TPR) repeat protein
MRSPFPLLLASLVFVVLPLAAQEEKSETLPERTLRKLIDHERTLLADAAKQGDKLDPEAFRVQVQELCHEYELLLHDSPNYALAYADYGQLLYKLDMRKEAVNMLLKADQLDPNIALVKNEIGNYLAEEDKPLEAVNYFLAAVKLVPDEPLYHYELGKLLYTFRDDFLKSGDWTRGQIDEGMHNGFKRAAELAPDRIEFTYRYAESFADMAKPDWDGALNAWAALEEKAATPLERDTMRLQAANVLIKQGKFAHARFLIDAVTEPKLDAQKQKLIAQLPPAPAK